MKNANLKLILGIAVFFFVSVSSTYAVDLKKIKLTDEETQQLTENQIKERIKFLVEMNNARTEEERAQDVEYRKRYKDTFAIDALTVGAPSFPEIGFTDEMFQSMVDEAYTDVGIDVMSTTISNGSDNFDDPYARMDKMKAFEKNSNGKYRIVRVIDDLYQAKEKGQFAIILNAQSTDMLEADLSNVQKFYDKGLRQMNFTYNVANPSADGMMSNLAYTMEREIGEVSKELIPALRNAAAMADCSHGEQGCLEAAEKSGVVTKDAGLSEFGEKLVAEMNRVGMVVDCSHSSDETCIDAAKLSSKPIIASHSNPRFLYDLPRNTRDEAIKAVASTGGAICVNFLGGFLNSAGNAGPKDIAKHVDYIKQLVGAQAACVGSDYVHNFGYALDPILHNPDKYPPSSGYGSVSQMGLPQDMWGVARVLEEEHGWTEKEIRGFLGENVIRIYKANWK